MAIIVTHYQVLLTIFNTLPSITMTKFVQLMLKLAWFCKLHHHYKQIYIDE